MEPAQLEFERFDNTNIYCYRAGKSLLFLIASFDFMNISNKINIRIGR